MTRRPIPIELFVEGWPTAVVGSHADAIRRIRLLGEAGARVTLFSAAPPAEFVQACEAIGASRVGRLPAESDLQPMRLVYYVDRDPAFARELRRWAERHGFLLCANDVPQACDFFMPAIVRRGDFTIAVGTNGASPALAARLRAQIEAIFDERVERFVERLRSWRSEPRGAAGAAERCERLRAAVEAVELSGTLRLPEEPR